MKRLSFLNGWFLSFLTWGAPVPVLAQLSNLDNVPKQVTIHLEKATLSEVVQHIGVNHGVNVLSDIYSHSASHDLTLLTISVNRSSLHDALSEIARYYSRDLIWVGNIAVLRHKEWYLNAHLELNYGNRWKDPGQLTLQCSRENKEMMIPPVLLKQMPAQTISLQARAVTLENFASRFNQETGWTLEIEKELSQRRINAWLQNVVPSELLTALTQLLYASQKVSILRNEAQKRLANDLGAKSKSFREIWSDALKPELEKLLTDEQRKRYRKGEIISLPFHTLSPDLQDMAAGYVLVSYRRLQGLDPNNPMPPLNLSRVSEFTLDLLPLPNLVVGVSAYSEDGKKMVW